MIGKQKDILFLQVKRQANRLSLQISRRECVSVLVSLLEHAFFQRRKKPFRQSSIQQQNLKKINEEMQIQNRLISNNSSEEDRECHFGHCYLFIGNRDMKFNLILSKKKKRTRQIDSRRSAMKKGGFLEKNKMIYILQALLSKYQGFNCTKNEFTIIFISQIMKGRLNLALAVLLLLACQTLAAVTFQPAPPINMTDLFNVSNSAADSKLILSPKLEVLGITHAVVMGNATSTFEITAYNRSAPGFRSTYNLTLPGSWNHVKSSLLSLSCSVVMENTTHNLGLLSFGQFGGVRGVRMLGAIPLANLTSDTPNITQIADAIVIGQHCRVLSFTSSSNQTLIYRASPDFSEINIVLLPANWAIQAATLDLMYGISSNKLYRYNTNTFEYQQIFTFDPHMNYKMTNWGGRIIVTCANATIINATWVPPLLQSRVKIYVFNDGPQGLVKVGDEIFFQHVDNRLPQVFTSSRLTKFGLGVRQSLMAPTVVIAKHVDYVQNRLFDLTWTDPVRYMQTVQRIDPMRELYFNDVFLVVRNGTYFNSSQPMKRPYEVAYQFTGTKVEFLRDRNLLANSTVDNVSNTTTFDPVATKELTYFVKNFVDESQTDRLIVINIYATGPGTYSVTAFDYGSLQFNLVIDTPVTPPFISFEEPPFDDVHPLSRGFNWAYLKRASNITNITVIYMDNSTLNHTGFMTQSFPGQWHLLFENHHCQIASEGNLFMSMFTLILYHSNNQTFSAIDITTLVHALGNITNNTRWGASDDCTRISINNIIFTRNPSSTTFSPVPGNNTAVDSNLTIAISNDGNLYGFNPQTSSLSLLFTPQRPFPLGAKIQTFGTNMIVYFADSNGTAFVQGFRRTPGQAPTLCLNYTSKFDLQAKISISPSLTKVLVMGPFTPLNASSAITKVDVFFVDYAGGQAKNVSFPVPIENAAMVDLDLQDSFLYLRQLNNTVNNTNPPQEFAFFFSQDTTLIKAFTRNLTFPANVEWKRTLIYNSPEGKHFLFTETLRGASAPKTRVVEVVEINGQQATLNNNPNPTYTAQIENGQIRLCPPGCTDCDCTGCLTGYVMETQSSSCRPCPPGCTICSASNSSVCEVCITGSFLNTVTKQCDPCAQGCISCTSGASCSTCPPGLFYSGSQCMACPLNCFNCSNANTCITCRKGFTVTSSGSCRGCSYSCSDCEATNITKCTACAKGLQLNNDKCVVCPDRCKECNNNVCAVCVDGYTPNAAGVCITKCQLPCLTCQDNQPNYCLSCQSGSTASGGVCALDISCNSNFSCTNCGQGLKYVLTVSSSGATCEPCPQMANCIQCDRINNFECAICKNSYYISLTGTCEACNSNCTSCKSSAICTGCFPGFTLMEGYNEGPCLACKAPCASCQNSPDYCTSCTAGFTKQGWKCRNNTYIGFKFTLQGASGSQVMNAIDTIVARILQILGEQTSNIEAVTFETIADGSTILVGNVATTGSTSVSAGSTTLASGLAGGLVGFSVTGIETTAYGVESTQESSTNVGLIVGLVVGLTAAVVIVIVVIVVIKKKATLMTVQPIQDSNKLVVQHIGNEKVLQNSGIEIDPKMESNDLFENV